MTDPSFAQKRKAKETKRMKALPTVYPYGINHKVGDETITNKDYLIGSKIFSIWTQISSKSGK